MLGLTFKQAQRLQRAIDRRRWNNSNDSIMQVQAGAGRALAQALSKSANLQDLKPWTDPEAAAGGAKTPVQKAAIGKFVRNG